MTKHTAATAEMTMPATTPPTKQPTTFSITLTAPGTKLVLLAIRKSDGTGMTTATTIDVVAKKSTRGMTERHTNFDLAKGAIRKQAQAAEKLGWTHRPAGRIFAAKPDAFTTLPTPPTAAGTKGKK